MPWGMPLVGLGYGLDNALGECPCAYPWGMPLGVECLGNALVYFGDALESALRDGPVMGRLWAGDGPVMGGDGPVMGLRCAGCRLRMIMDRGWITMGRESNGRIWNGVSFDSRGGGAALRWRCR
jgi:hypothetical protein